MSLPYLGRLSIKHKCCPSIEKSFADLNDLNSYEVDRHTAGNSRMQQDTDNDPVCVICTEPLSNESPEGTNALTAIYEPIDEPIVEPQEGSEEPAQLGKRSRDESGRPIYNGCGHIFHRTCLRRWIIGKADPTCPQCRASIDSQIVEELKPSAYYHLDRKDGMLLSVEFESGIVLFYEGGKGDERKVRVKYPGGYVQFFEGEKGEERKVRVKYPGGMVEFFQGEKGEERKVRSDFMGIVTLYRGEKGEERKVRADYTSGSKHFFTGRKGYEKLVRTKLPNGDVMYFDGEKGEEYLVMSGTFADRKLLFFEGKKGEERLVRILHPNGDVEIWGGPKGQETLLQTTTCEEDSTCTMDIVRALQRRGTE